MPVINRRNILRWLRGAGIVDADNWQTPRQQHHSGIQQLCEPDTSRTLINTTYSHDSGNDFVLVTYSFQGPEANIGTEQRSIELSPHFQSSCPPQ